MVYCYVTNQIDKFLAAEEFGDARDRMIEDRTDQMLDDAKVLSDIVWADSERFAAAIVDWLRVENALQASDIVLEQKIRAIVRRHAAEDVDEDLRGDGRI